VLGPIVSGSKMVMSAALRRQGSRGHASRASGRLARHAVDRVFQRITCFSPHPVAQQAGTVVGTVALVWPCPAITMVQMTLYGEPRMCRCASGSLLRSIT